MNRTPDKNRRHLLKRAPQHAATSTVRSDPSQVRLAPTTDPGAKRRFQDAYALWSNAADGSREIFADELGVPFSAVKRWLSGSDARPVDPAALEAAEYLAASVRGDISDAEVAGAVRQFARVLAALMESAA